MRTKTSIFKGVSKFRDKWRARIRQSKNGDTYIEFID